MPGEGDQLQSPDVSLSNYGGGDACQNQNV